MCFGRSRGAQPSFGVASPQSGLEYGSNSACTMQERFIQDIKDGQNTKDEKNGPDGEYEEKSEERV